MGVLPACANSSAIASGGTIQTGGADGVNAPDTSSSPRRRGPIRCDVDVLDSFGIVLHCCAITVPPGLWVPAFAGTTRGRNPMSANDALHIAVLAGDGIGPEVMAPALEVLRRIEATSPLKFRFTDAAAGA